MSTTPTNKPASSSSLNDERRVDLYRHMLRLRLLDGRMLNLQRQGRIGFYGPCTGQEASVIGTAAALKDTDWVFPALREAGITLFRGYSLVDMVTQLMGRDGEPSRGRQMPCHYTFREKNYVSMSSVIGTQISQAAGAAMAARIRGDDTVIMGYMGDGATSSNDFHCGLNFAAVYQAPVVFVCQNNHWAISVRVDKQTTSESIAVKAEAYGMPGVRVDGNDIAAVYETTREAVERARAGKGPTLIEAETYRILGHSSSDDPTRYRDEDEVKNWEAKDPLKRERAYLESRGLWDQDKEQDVQDVLMAEISDAIREAESRPMPPRHSLFEDVYQDVPAHLRDSQEQLEDQIKRAESTRRQS